MLGKTGQDLLAPGGIEPRPVLGHQRGRDHLRGLLLARDLRIDARLRALADEADAGRDQLLGQRHEVGLGALTRHEERLLHRDLAGDPRARLAQGGRDAVGHLAVSARRGHDDGPLAVQQMAQQEAGVGLGEGVDVGELLLQVSLVGQQGVDFLPLLLRRLVQVFERAGLQRRGADDDADRQRQEHGDDRNKVITEINH